MGISRDGLVERLRGLRPNASMAAISRRLPHLDVWGGCCGTWDDHLRALAQQLRPL